jgi:hypothetical protein
VIHVDIVEVVIMYTVLLKFQVIGWIWDVIGISNGASFRPLVSLLQLYIIAVAFAVVLQIVIKPILLWPVRVSMTVVGRPGHYCGLQAAPQT